MGSLDDALRDAFERQRKSAAYNLTIELRRTRALRSLAEADQRRTEKLGQAEKLRQPQEYLDIAEAKREAARRRYFQGPAIEKFNQWKAGWILEGLRERPEVTDRPRHGIVSDPETCAHDHYQQGTGHCSYCGMGGSYPLYKPKPLVRISLSAEDVSLIKELHATLHDPNTPIEFCTKPTCYKLRQYRHAG